VLDCGSGYTKLGFAGNAEASRHQDGPACLCNYTLHGLTSGAGSPQPSIVIPTVVATPPLRAHPGSLDDLDYSTGDAALSAAPSWSLHHPVKQGVVSAVPLLGALCLAARTLVQPRMPARRWTRGT